ncbi:IucA/IucC family siderophore biosynthesis protein [Sedimentitalea sp. XS_ASV28]|uniref:IucA/IucC family protein n=1 Tax=Sedimentitalea sp. XS_ASV28 TaxID=3241296 RepID=UPI0035180640
MIAAYGAASRRLLAKMISELAWEEVVSPRAGALQLASGAVWRFRGERRIWGNLDIDPDSIAREGGETSPFRLIADARAEMGMTPATEAMFIREIANTLAQDVATATKWGALDGQTLIALPSEDLHAALEGHPKALANRGRLGWGMAENAAYAPEAARPIRLFWLAMARGDLLEAGSTDAVLRDCLGTDFTRLSKAAGADALMPVHPWQWNGHLAQITLAEQAEGRIRPLGEAGPAFRATPSIRTLTRAGGSHDVKLSLGILNTSAWRGVPGRFIEHGPAISDWLAGICAADPDLAEVFVLRETAGLWWRDPVMALCADAPYRHHETLGTIWRDRAETRAEGATPVLHAALFHCGTDGAPLALHYARQADMEPEDWLADLFRVTVVPLWLLLARYGVGFIAHGQNITVLLDEGRPVGMMLKDFQGDMDLVDQEFPESSGLDPAIRAILPRKPPLVIIHDIQTAHFITSLRFLSARLSRWLPESRFYAILRDELLAARARHPDLATRFALFDLFAPKMPKVCINKVRFEIGYEDRASRPLPARGTDLDNPLFTGY